MAEDDVASVKKERCIFSEARRNQLGIWERAKRLLSLLFTPPSPSQQTCIMFIPFAQDVKEMKAKENSQSIWEDK